MLIENNKDDWQVMWDCWKPGERTYLDIETTGFDPYTEKLVMITIGQQNQDGPDVFVIDARGGFTSWQQSFIKSVIKDSKEIVGHNLAFDLSWLYHHFHVWPKRVWDTMIVEQCIKGRGLSSAKADGISFGLKQLAKDYAHTDLDKETREYFIGLDHRIGESGGRAWDEPFPDDAVFYASLDVDVLLDIYGQQKYEYDKSAFEEALDDIPRLARCVDLENKAVIVYAHMKLSGMPVNVGEWRDVIEEKDKEAKELETQALKLALAPVLNQRSIEFDQLNEVRVSWEQARDQYLSDLRAEWELSYGDLNWGQRKQIGLKAWKVEHPAPPKPKLNTELNLGSPTQLMELFGILGINVRNTSKEELKRVADEHPVVKAIVDWREAEKFVTSFGDAVLNNVNPVTHRIHPDWQQIGADTGRSSCQRPNLQQIPARTATGKKLRHCVQAPDGWVFCDADFSSQELVILAYMSGEQRMIGAFERGEDLHARTAALMFDLGPDVDTRKHMVNGLSARDIAKTINYGIAYGMTKYRLGKLVKIDYDTAQTFIDKWYEAFPQAKAWLDARKKQVLKGQLYSETLHGWVRRYSPLGPEPVKPAYGRGDWKQYKEAHRAWEMEKNGLENQMMNSPIQGSGAGMTKYALTLFFDRAIIHPVIEYRIAANKAQIIAAIHDENLTMCRKEDADKVAPLLAQCMDDAMAHFLPGMTFPKAEVKVSGFWEH